MHQELVMQYNTAAATKFEDKQDDLRLNYGSLDEELLFCTTGKRPKDCLRRIYLTQTASLEVFNGTAELDAVRQFMCGPKGDEEEFLRVEFMKTTPRTAVIQWRDELVTTFLISSKRKTGPDILKVPWEATHLTPGDAGAREHYRSWHVEFWDYDNMAYILWEKDDFRCRHHSTLEGDDLGALVPVEK